MNWIDILTGAYAVNAVGWLGLYLVMVVYGAVNAVWGWICGKSAREAELVAFIRSNPEVNGYALIRYIDEVGRFPDDKQFALFFAHLIEEENNATTTPVQQ